MTSLIETQLKNNVDAIPMFLMGHSMGGAQVLQWIARGPDELKQQISGYLAESPFIAIHPDSQPARFTVIAGRLAARFLPKRQMIQKLDPNMMSRDQEICQQYDADTLCHDTGTLEGLAGMLQRAEELERGTVVIKDRTNLQIWVGHGSGDKVCSFDATQKFMSRLEVKEKDFRVYDGWYHKLHAEPGDDKKTFANEVADWILARTTQITNQTAKIEGTQSKL
ncbi:glucose-6-phosphate 1-dehydrogenase [Physcia stellaris]|nr:glucose-6-phosphate 1-dehydrogenase [Physcia stellaris]